MKWLAAFLAFVSLASVCASAGAAPIQMQVLMNAKSARALGIGTLAPALAITPDGIAVLADDHGVFAVGATVTRPLPAFNGLSSFAYSPDGFFLGVRGRDLLYLDAGKALKPLYRLPAAGMTVREGTKDTFLLYGVDDRGRYALYVIGRHRVATKVLQISRPITSVVQTGDAILATIDGALYLIKDARMVLLAGEAGAILDSVAFDAAAGAIYVSDGAHIFAFRDGKVHPVVQDLGGDLRWVQSGLVVYNRRNKILVRLAGLSSP